MKSCSDLYQAHIRPASNGLSPSDYEYNWKQDRLAVATALCAMLHIANFRTNSILKKGPEFEHLATHPHCFGVLPFLLVFTVAILGSIEGLE